MKKYLYFLSVLAAALAFTACSSDGEDVGAPVAPTLSSSSIKNEPMTLKFKEGSPIKKVVLSETQKAIITVATDKYEAAPIQQNAPRRAPGSGEDEYIVGSFKISGSTYTIYNEAGDEYCTLVVVSKDGSKASVKVSLKAESTVYEGEADVAEKIASDEITNILCREWTIATTRLRHKGGVTGVKQFEKPTDNPASLNDILTYAKSVATINEHFDDDMTITSIDFTSDGTFCIFFKNNKHYIGEWKWKDSGKGIIKYGWDNENMGNKFENGQATFDLRQYKKVGYYTLTLGADIQDGGNTYQVELSFYLNEK